MLRSVTLISLTALLCSLGGQPARASDFWDEVRSPGLRRYRRHVAEAREVLAAARHQEALEHADAAVAELDDRAEGHELRARALGELGRLEEAATAYRRALELDERALDAPRDGEAAALVLAKMGQFELAARILRRVVGQMRPSHHRTELYVLYGDVLLAIGPSHLDDSLVAYREALRSRTRQQTRAELGLLLALRRAGHLEEASAASGRVGDRTRVEQALSEAPVGAAERAAREACWLQATGERDAATQRWRVVAEAGPWRVHAEEELERLGEASGR